RATSLHDALPIFAAVLPQTTPQPFAAHQRERGQQVRVEADGVGEEPDTKGELFSGFIPRPGRQRRFDDVGARQVLPPRPARILRGDQPAGRAGWDVLLPLAAHGGQRRGGAVVPAQSVNQRTPDRRAFVRIKLNRRLHLHRHSQVIGFEAAHTRSSCRAYQVYAWLLATTRYGSATGYSTRSFPSRTGLPLYTLACSNESDSPHSSSCCRMVGIGISPGSVPVTGMYPSGRRSTTCGAAASWTKPPRLPR